MVSDQDSREVILQAAISDLNNGVFTSVRACAKAYNVPRSTLSDRLAHRPTRSMARQQQQWLSPEQEYFIVAWILMEDLAGCPPIHVSDIMPLASHGENCGKGRAEGLYNLAYQRPQLLQKGHNRIRTEKELINYTYTAHYLCYKHTLLCMYST
jgi:hypothetical protein